MRKISLMTIVMILSSCGENNFSATGVISGNLFQLSNGIVVELANVSDSESNIKILERYLTDEILLYDTRTHNQIQSFNSDTVSAIVYNSDGDCLNDLLTAVEEITEDDTPLLRDNNSENGTTISFSQENGVLTVPVAINGIRMYFIFDTGASLISISSTQAKYLFDQGKLNEDDFVGKAQFSDANGDISEGIIINLATVTIGDRTLTNVHACVVQNQNAPLLLGQSALEKFGKISIDYHNSEITFE
jgi:aspartyl protease family protein